MTRQIDLGERGAERAGKSGLEENLWQIYIHMLLYHPKHPLLTSETQQSLCDQFDNYDSLFHPFEISTRANIDLAREAIIRSETA